MKTLFLIIAFVAVVYGDSIEQGIDEESIARIKWFDKITHAVNSAKNKIHNVVDKTKHDIHNAVDKTKHDIHNVVDKTKHDIHNVVDKTKHDVHNVVDKTKHDVHNAVDKTKEGVHKIVDKTKNDVHKAVDKTKEGIHKIEDEIKEKERIFVEKVRKVAKKFIAIVKKTLSAHCENTTCTLCANIGQDNIACVDVAVDLTEIAADIDLKVNDKVIISKKFEARNPEALCVPIVLSVEGCLQAYDLSISKEGFHMCFRIAADALGQEVISYNVKCVTVHGKKFELEDPPKKEHKTEEEETKPNSENDQSVVDQSDAQRTE